MLLCLLAIVMPACQEASKNEDLEDTASTIMKVRVYRDGRITLDGAEAAVGELPAAFAALKERDGVVWYYREGGRSEPHPNVMAVVDAIVDAKLPVSLSSEEDFSNIVLPDGSTQPRP